MSNIEAVDNVPGKTIRTVLLIRHPPVPAAWAARCYGQTDVALSSDWAEDAAVNALLERADGPGRASPIRIHTSPLSRCARLAELLHGELARREVLAPSERPRHDARLGELDFGEWEGRRWADIRRDDIDAWASDPAGFRPPGGETFTDLAERWHDFLRSLGTDDATEHWVVTHGGPIRAAVALALGGPLVVGARLSIAPLGTALIDYPGGADADSPLGIVRWVNR